MDLNYYNIHINPAGLGGELAKKYDRDVSEFLLWIYRTTSGRILLNCLRNPNYPMEIRPHPKHECNARGGGEPNRHGGPWTGFVTFTPYEFTPWGSCGQRAPNQNRGMLWDEILFHELIHVFRNSTGKWNDGRTLSAGMRQYGSNEEFIAVLCTNIYMSDRTNKIKSGLRAGWYGFGAMSAADAARFGLFVSSKAAFSLVEAFCNDNPIFTKALSDQLADVEYNPIADYYRFPEVCKELSRIGGFQDYPKIVAALVRAGVQPETAAKLAAPVLY
jgi:hypothetical protein